MLILGIETSCDETAVSIVEAKGDLKSLDFKVLGSALHSQVEMHAEYGGVVPRLAKREHQKNLPLVLEKALTNAKTKLSDIDIIAVTVGPGLEPALWVGIQFAEDLGQELGIPVIPTNHMVGHIASVLLNKTDAMTNSLLVGGQAKLQISNQVEFPAIALLISGGHTELVFLENWAEMKKIGETKDDAVGEAFDKVARMLGLPYPGGPEISKLAQTARENGIESDKKLPRPMIHSKDFNFSFSGLKTAVLYYLKDLENSLSAPKKNFSTRIQMAIAREFEDAVIETLLSKTRRAIEEYLPKTLIIGGGVIANKALRENFLKLESDYPNLSVLIPEKQLTTDNAVMIAAAGYIEYLKSGSGKRELMADGNMSIK